MIIQGDFEGNGLEPVIGTGTQSQAAGADPEIGAVHLASTDRVLPGVIARAANSGTPFSLVVARPGPAASPGHPAGMSSAGPVADLAAALSVSLGPSQELLQAGPHHLAVVVPGNTAQGRRQAVQLMQRAAGAGAPLFTWAAARFPRDATNADRLVEVARRRVDGIDLAQDRPAAALAASGFRWRTGAIWAGVAAAALVGALVFGFHGSGGPRSGGNSATAGGQSGAGTSGNAGTGSAGGSAALASGAGSTFPGPGNTSAGPSGSQGHPSGSGGTGTSAGTSTGTQPTGSGGGQQSTTQSGSGSGAGGSTTTGSGGSSGSGSATGTATTDSGSGSGSGGGLTTVLGNTVGTVLGTASGLTGTATSTTGTATTGSGTTGTTGTTTTGTTGTGSTSTGSSTNQCSGLLNTLTCTVNGLPG